MQETMTKEPQYQIQFESLKEQGSVVLGPTTSHLWRSDPKHLLFFLSRYKFVSKILTGKKKILEVGCGDGFGSRIVTQNGSHVVGADFDELFIKDAAQREAWDTSRSFRVVDFVKGAANEKFDGIYSLDVIEHIEPKDEATFLQNVISSLADDGLLVFGTPSLESQTYASVWSKAGHINCKTGEQWRKTFSEYFTNVMVFSMNDEVVHTGFLPMAHYLFIVCTGRRK